MLLVTADLFDQKSINSVRILVFFFQDYRTNMAMGSISCLVLLSLLLGEVVSAEGRRLNVSQCELNSISFRELREHFSAIRENVQTQDTRTDVILLKESVLHELPVNTVALEYKGARTERCCLLRHLLRFYIERIFRHYEPTNNLLRSKSSALANAFLGIKANLRQCHNQNKCSCGEESHRRFKLVLEEYEKLDKNVATMKAMGEIDLLLAWIEAF
ncbi:Interleukin-20 [Varanus komodoensis]|nr:Interleukin-20 [Varanus komodoensis]